MEKTELIKKLKELTIPCNARKATSLLGGEFNIRRMEEKELIENNNCYYKNNGVIVLVVNGERRVGVSLKELNNILEELNFAEKEMTVPLSNGEEPIFDSNEKDEYVKWQKLQQMRRDELNPRVIKRYQEEEVFKEFISKVGFEGDKKQMVESLKSLDELSIDCENGVSFEIFGGGSTYTCEPLQTTELRKKQTATYSTNNGMVAFIDKTGHYRLAPRTKNLMDVLMSMGYKEGNLAVPGSNGEKLKFDDIKTETKWDVLDNQSWHESFGSFKLRQVEKKPQEGRTVVDYINYIVAIKENCPRTYVTMNINGVEVSSDLSEEALYSKLLGCKKSGYEANPIHYAGRNVIDFDMCLKHQKSSS